MAVSTEFDRELFLIGLRIGKFLQGYVDHYYGPTALFQTVKREIPKSPTYLLDTTRCLLQQVPNQGFDFQREPILKKILTAMTATLKILRGERLDFLEFLQLLFDIKPRLIEEKRLYSAITRLQGFNEENVGNERIISQKQQQDLINWGLETIRERTQLLFSDLFPPCERIFINHSPSTHFHAYEHYLGNFKSIVDIDLNFSWTQHYLLFILAHEAYPGHHTEFTIKEKMLYQRKSLFEYGILPLLSPLSVISEGIASVAPFLIFNSADFDFFNEIIPLSDVDWTFETWRLVADHQFLYNAIKSNMLLYRHAYNWNNCELTSYLQQFDFFDDNYITTLIESSYHPLWDPYTFCYVYGTDLIAQKYGASPSPANFRELFTQQLLPSDLN